MKPEGLWNTFNTTPPLPEPSSPCLVKSSSFISPIFSLLVKNNSRFLLSVSLIFNSSNFFVRASRLWILKTQNYILALRNVYQYIYSHSICYIHGSAYKHMVVIFYKIYCPLNFILVMGSISIFEWTRSYNREQAETAEQVNILQQIVYLSVNSSNTVI